MPELERKSVAGPVVGVLWMLSISGTFFSGIAVVGSMFPDAAKVFFGVCLAAFASATAIGVGMAFFMSVERIDRE